LEGHSKAVTALYYEDGCLVSRTGLQPRSRLLCCRRSPAHPTRLSDSGTSIPVNAF
jgi:hypothetical protein